MNAFYKTIFQAHGINSVSFVSQETKTMNVQRLPCVSDECLLQDHLLSLWYWLTEPCLPKRLVQWMCRGFPMLVMNALYKIIFQAHVLTQWAVSQENGLKLHLPGDLIKHAEASLYQWWTPFTRLSAEPMVLNQWALSSRKMAESSVSKEAWMNVHRLPCISDDQPLQDHLLKNPIVSSQPALPRELNNKCTEVSLCQWWTPPYRSISEEAYHTDLMSCLPRHLNNEHTELPCVSDECPLQDHLLDNPIILTQWAVTQKTWMILQKLSCVSDEHHLPWKPTVFTWQVLLHQKLNNEHRGFPVSVINILYTTIF